jgi:hypothetical protein
MLASLSSFRRQARTRFCSVLVIGSLPLGREGSQNVTLVLGLHIGSCKTVAVMVRGQADNAEVVAMSQQGRIEE